MISFLRRIRHSLRLYGVSSLTHRTYSSSVSSNIAEDEEEERKTRQETEIERTEEMIPRSNLAEQLREYQIRSKYEWTPFSFSSFSSSNLTSRVDFVISVVWELVILAFLVLSAVSLYFRYMRLAFCLICITILLLIGLKIMKQVRLDRKTKRRMLLPLSM